MKLTIVLGCLVACFSSLVSAQDGYQDSRELFGLTGTYSTIRKDTIHGNSQQVEAFLNQPLLRKNNHFLGARLGYHYNRISEVSDLLNQKLTGIDMNLLWQWRLKDSSKIQINGQAGIFSDFKDISRSDFRGRIAANYLFKVSKKVKMGAGIAYSRQFDAHQLNPFISIHYQISSRWSLMGVLPIKPVLLYKINSKFQWKTEVQGKVESYRLSAKTYNNAVIDKTGWYFTTEVEWLVKKHHRFSGGIGYSFRQSIRYYADSEMNNWKIFTFDLSSKNSPVTTVSTKGVRFTIKYAFVF